MSVDAVIPVGWSPLGAARLADRDSGDDRSSRRAAPTGSALLTLLQWLQDLVQLGRQVGQVAHHDRPHDSWTHMPVAVGRQVPHICQMTPRNLPMAPASLFPDGVGRFADRLQPTDRRGRQYLIVDEHRLRVGAVTVDGPNQLHDVEQKAAIAAQRATASAGTLSRIRGFTSVLSSTGNPSRS